MNNVGLTRRYGKAADRWGILLLLCLIIIIFGCLSIAQQTKPANSAASGNQAPGDQGGFRIGVEVNMVTVPVTIRGQDGTFIKNLPKNAFRITEDGAEQEVLNFVQEAVPTRIALVLDISGSVGPEWGTIKYATKKFAENLKQDDQFSLVTFNTETRLKMDWGRSTDRIDAVLSSIFCKGLTNLWDTIWVVGNDVLKGIKEKKAIIIMSDGLDNNSSVTYEEALKAAVQSEAAVYIVSKTEAVRQSLLYDLKQQSIYTGVRQEDFHNADSALRRLAYETGGRVLYPNSFGQLDNIYAQVDEELRNQYTLGYISSNPRKDGNYRHIEVSVANPNALLTARPGYYAPKQ
jgi:Ca-activated chloride channel family protein